GLGAPTEFEVFPAASWDVRFFSRIRFAPNLDPILRIKRDSLENRVVGDQDLHVFGDCWDGSFVGVIARGAGVQIDTALAAGVVSQSDMFSHHHRNTNWGRGCVRRRTAAGGNEQTNGQVWIRRE